MTAKFWISLATAPLARLTDLAQSLEAAGADGLHIDIVDGVFAPSLTLGHSAITALTDAVTIPIEAHLMVTNPEEQLRAAVDAGADRVAFHLESTMYPARVARIGQSLGVPVGLALNPVTPITSISYLKGILAFANVLTTEPDMFGEALLPFMAQRVKDVGRQLGSTSVLEVDGGIRSIGDVSRLARAGASEFVVGRAILSHPDPPRLLSSLRVAADKPKPRSGVALRT